MLKGPPRYFHGHKNRRYSFFVVSNFFKLKFFLFFLYASTSLALVILGSFFSKRYFLKEAV